MGNLVNYKINLSFPVWEGNMAKYSNIFPSAWENYLLIILLLLLYTSCSTSILFNCRLLKPIEMTELTCPPRLPGGTVKVFDSQLWCNILRMRCPAALFSKEVGGTSSGCSKTCSTVNVDATLSPSLCSHSQYACPDVEVAQGWCSLEPHSGSRGLITAS